MLIRDGTEFGSGTHGGAVRVIGLGSLAMSRVVVEDCSHSAVYAEGGTQVTLRNSVLQMCDAGSSYGDNG